MCIDLLNQTERVVQNLSDIMIETTTLANMTKKVGTNRGKKKPPMPGLYLKKDLLKSKSECQNCNTQIRDNHKTESYNAEEYISENSYFQKITILRIPMSFENIFALVIIVILALFGTFHLCKLATRQF